MFAVNDQNLYIFSAHKKKTFLLCVTFTSGIPSKNILVFKVFPNIFFCQQPLLIAA